jgi:hypothetical protein
MMSEGTSGAGGSFMAASAVRPTGFSPTVELARRCAQALQSVQHTLAQRGAFLQESDVSVLKQLPGQLVLPILQGLDAPNVRNPGALLRWKLGQPHVQAALRGPPLPQDGYVEAGASTQPPTAAPSQIALPAQAPPQHPQPPARATAPESPPQPQVLRLRGDPLTNMNVHCPGCGYTVPALSTRLEPPRNPFRESSMMAFTSAWGQHECGASWMCTRVPRSFGIGIGLSAWLLQQPGPGAYVPTTPARGSGEPGSPASALSGGDVRAPEHIDAARACNAYSV